MKNNIILFAIIIPLNIFYICTRKRKFKIPALLFNIQRIKIPKHWSRICFRKNF